MKHPLICSAWGFRPESSRSCRCFASWSGCSSPDPVALECAREDGTWSNSHSKIDQGFVYNRSWKEGLAKYHAPTPVPASFGIKACGRSSQIGREQAYQGPCLFNYPELGAVHFCLRRLQPRCTRTAITLWADTMPLPNDAMIVGRLRLLFRAIASAVSAGQTIIPVYL